MLNDGHPETLALLDPSLSGRTEGWPWDAFPEEFKRVDHDLNNLGNQQALAQRGASTTIFCAEGTYVRAGEPVFYAVPCEEAEGGKSLFVTVGVSDTKREASGTSRSEPGPTRLDRTSYARRGFAFDIGEIDEALCAFQARGYSVERNCDIDVLLERHRPQTAPVVCVRELALSLFAVSEEDKRRERLHAEVPVIGAATNEHQVEDQCIDALHQLCSSNDPVVAYGFPGERRAAKAILVRLGIGLSKALAPQDDEALAALGPG